MNARHPNWPKEAIEIINVNYLLPRGEIRKILLLNGYNMADKTISIYKKAEYIRVEGAEWANKRIPRSPLKKERKKFIIPDPPPPPKPTIPINELKDRVYLKFETGMHGELPSQVAVLSRFAFIEAAWRLGYTHSQIAYVLGTKRHSILNDHRELATNRKLVREVTYILQDFGLIPVRKAS